MIMDRYMTASHLFFCKDSFALTKKASPSGITQMLFFARPS